MSPVMTSESSNGAWGGASEKGRPDGSVAWGFWTMTVVVMVMSMRLISAVIIDQMKLIVGVSGVQEIWIYRANTQDAELDVGELRGSLVSQRASEIGQV